MNFTPLLVFPYFFRSSNFEFPARIKKTKKLAGNSSARPPNSVVREFFVVPAEKAQDVRWEEVGGR